MPSRLQAIGGVLRRGAEWVAVILFTALFGAFLLQIFTRYVLDNPLGWTLELCLAAWLWVVFWSATFLVREQNHVAFNIFYLAASPPTRRVLAVLSTIVLLVGFAVMLPPTWDFVSFMKIDSTPVLKIRFDYLFAIFLIFVVAVIVRAAMRLRRLMSPTWEAEANDMGSGGL